MRHADREVLDVRDVTQVQRIQVQPPLEAVEVRFGGEAERGVAREAGGADDRSPAAQQDQAALVADLDTAAGQDGHLACEVRRLAPLGVVERGAAGAELASAAEGGERRGGRGGRGVVRL
jgi:hypothetical protein